MQIRLASLEDAAQVQAIYVPVVRETAISFEWEPPSVEEIASRIRRVQDANLPWLVLDRSSEILGYVYAGPHRGDRMAYRWSVEVSVYIHPQWHRKGVGRALYTSLFSILRLQGFQNVYAGATQPNPGSVALHEAMGFREVGLYRKVGFKFGKWHDVLWWYLTLGSHPESLDLPLSLEAVQAHPGWSEALDAGLPLLRL